MCKKIFQIISTIAVIATVESPLAAFDSGQSQQEAAIAFLEGVKNSGVYVSDLQGRTQTVGTQLAIQMQLNQLTGQNHSTLVKAISAATDEQCNIVAHSGSGGREALLDYNQYSNQAKHNFDNNDFEDCYFGNNDDW
jgi:hypothetical protein